MCVDGKRVRSEGEGGLRGGFRGERGVIGCVCVFVSGVRDARPRHCVFVFLLAPFAAALVYCLLKQHTFVCAYDQNNAKITQK